MSASRRERERGGGGGGGECKLKGNLSSFHCQPSASNRLAFLGSTLSMFEGVAILKFAREFLDEEINSDGAKEPTVLLNQNK